MTRLGYDNTGPLTLATCRKYGFTFSCRYLSRYTDKVVKASELLNARQWGHDLVLVFEDEAARARRGHDVGVADAQFARHQAQTILGVTPRCIYFAVDYECYTPAECDDYFDGIVDVLGHDHCGPYGSYTVVKHFLDRGLKYAWQTYAWSSGSRDRRAQLYQYENTDAFDFDRAYYDDFGQIDYQDTATRSGDMIVSWKNAAGHDEYGVATSSGEVKHRWKEQNDSGQWGWHPDWTSLGRPGSDSNPIIGISAYVNQNGHDEYGVRLQDGTVKHLWKLEDGGWNHTDYGYIWESLGSPQ